MLPPPNDFAGGTMSKEEGKPRKVCARAPLPREILASVSHTAPVFPKEGESLLAKVQREFDFTDAQMRELIEPAIEKAVASGPRDEAEPPPTSDRSAAANFDRQLSRTLALVTNPELR